MVFSEMFILIFLIVVLLSADDLPEKLVFHGISTYFYDIFGGRCVHSILEAVRVRKPGWCQAEYFYLFVHVSKKLLDELSCWLTG